MYSFGWVNASYVYGLQIVNAHMKRALGAITPWDTFYKMTEGEYEPVEAVAHKPPPHTENASTEHHPAPVQYAHGHAEKHKHPNGLPNDVNMGPTQSPKHDAAHA